MKCTSTHSLTAYTPTITSATDQQQTSRAERPPLRLIASFPSGKDALPWLSSRFLCSSACSGTHWTPVSSGSAFCPGRPSAAGRLHAAQTAVQAGLRPLPARAAPSLRAGAWPAARPELTGRGHRPAGSQPSLTRHLLRRKEGGP